MFEAGKIDAGPHATTSRWCRRRRTSIDSIATARSRGGWRIRKGLTDDGGAAARARGQGVRPHRRRPALDGSRRTAAHAAAPLRPADARANEPESRGDARRRHPHAVADDQSGRPSDGGGLVHEARTNPTARSAPLPGLYQEYVGHDNNRDAYMLNMIESRVMEHTWRQWEPNIIYVHHQSSPFPTRIWLPPFAEPIATHAPFLMSRELNMIGMAIAQRLEQEGKVGATHMGTGYDAWYPGYIDYAPVFKNIPAFWTETQGNGAAPRDEHAAIRLPPKHAAAAGALPEPVARRHVAAARRRRVHGDGVDGDARVRREVQGRRCSTTATSPVAIRSRAAASKAPYAYVVPQDQRDPVAAVELLRRLAFAGVRVSQLSAPATIEGETFPAGTWIVPTDQEFAALAREVLDVQKYPEIRESPNGPLDQPYDAAGWTLPLAMGVRVVTRDEAARSRASARRCGCWARCRPGRSSRRRTTWQPAATPRRSTARPASASTRSGGASDRSAGRPRSRAAATALAVNPAENNAFRAVNRALESGRTRRVRRRRDAATLRHHRPLPAAQSELVTVARASRGADDGRGDMRASRASALFYQPDRAWTTAGRAGCSSSTASSIMRITGRRRAGEAACAASSTRCSSATAATSSRVTARGGRGGPGGGAPGGGGVLVARAPVPLQSARPPSRSIRAMAALDDFIRNGGTLVCFNRSCTFADRSTQAPRPQRRRRPQPAAVLRRRIAAARDDGSGASGDGGHAGRSGGVLRQRSGLRADSSDSGRRARELSAHRIAARSRDSCSASRYLNGTRRRGRRAATATVTW